jgi:hypothetical protein
VAPRGPASGDSGYKRDQANTGAKKRVTALSNLAVTGGYKLAVSGYAAGQLVGQPRCRGVS